MRGGARDFIAPFALLWAVSLIRVLAALVDGRPFGAIDTLAVISLLLLPWALARGRVRTR